eukprot:CAMPEP_0197651436 /NCGR_PEP_ID=MMETSP1338-20131121/32496_1 /TAXON_ID=43686 ORGANISM="Pelagodinium beii, Strain RCC1491" /NCGR_SAMPLE_ID=MMETSP1338 /ASSEMBLY_ACC=CAM_ASM_000754 /LENGTH=55 /DNA_ID=CAMNT_0043226065 /DNA_START=119 /DNA_END=283 /DNA_ORIENTATION=+
MPSAKKTVAATAATAVATAAFSSTTFVQGPAGTATAPARLRTQTVQQTLTGSSAA